MSGTDKVFCALDRGLSGSKKVTAGRTRPCPSRTKAGPKRTRAVPAWTKAAAARTRVTAARSELVPDGSELVPERRCAHLQRKTAFPPLKTTPPARRSPSRADSTREDDAPARPIERSHCFSHLRAPKFTRRELNEWRIPSHENIRSYFLSEFL